MGCCDKEEQLHQDAGSMNIDHCKPSARIDWLLWGSVTLIIPSYILYLVADNYIAAIPYLATFSHSIFELITTMWWGVLAGLVFVAILGKIPRELITVTLGKGGTFSGILRATLAGVLFDLCSHGILLVGMKLYERGASVGQVMAFLIASPWNSFSLTLVLWALIGFKWMMTFLLLSLVIALISGVIFESLVKHGVLPSNPNHQDLPEDFQLIQEMKMRFKSTNFDREFFRGVLVEGVSGSTMVLRWLLFGVILASCIRTFVPLDYFSTLFGSSVMGLGLTLIAATIIEVCSEGSAPIAADLVTRAAAPGNGFAFLMTGVSTDYTEIMILKDTTKSWKLALFLPLVTLPQVIAIALLINFSS